MGFRGFIDIDGPCMDLPFAFVNAAAGSPELPPQGLNIRRPELDNWLCLRAMLPSWMTAPSPVSNGRGRACWCWPGVAGWKCG